jgi:hypothetical protein
MREVGALIVGADIQRRRFAAALVSPDAELWATVYDDLPGGDDFRPFLDGLRAGWDAVERHARDAGFDVLGVFIEGAHMGINRRYALAHAEAIGAARALAARRWPWALAEVLAPASVRKALAIPQHGKQGITWWAVTTYPDHDLASAPQDVRDAVGVAAAACRLVER